MRCEWTVLKEDHGSKLLDFLQKSIQNPSSKRRIKSWIDSGLCFINGRTEKFHHTRIVLEDVIKLIIPNEDEADEKLEFSKERVLFEDEYILVYNKPSNLTSDHEGLVRHLSSHSKVILTHRLDKDTTGAIITAKHKVIEEEIVKQFQSRKVKKEYMALVHGRMKEDKGSIENYLGPINKIQGQTLWGDVDEKVGLFSITDWEVVERGEDASLVRLFPFTGRTHQLRVHQQMLNHPILGDSQYGHEKSSRIGVYRQMLHCHKLTFWHPYYSKTVVVEAPLPEDFQKVYKKYICAISS